MNLGEECHGALPELGDDDPLNPCPTPEPLLWCFKGKEPQMITTPTYIQHTEPVMMYTDDARPASSKVTCHHGLWLWGQMAGDGWWETDRLIASWVYEPWTIKNEI